VVQFETAPPKGYPTSRHIVVEPLGHSWSINLWYCRFYRTEQNRINVYLDIQHT